MKRSTFDKLNNEIFGKFEDMFDQLQNSISMCKVSMSELEAILDELVDKEEFEEG